ncbi:hypothetical protein FRC12_019578 [Ceratobasidium sp. 428]|nr:hypothetical protein FRC12_019578 [Ceratobasidium sp. 428]
MSACWSCQYNITFDVVSTTFTGFEKGCENIPDPITSYEASVRSSITALDLPAWSKVEPLAGKWDMASAWKNATPYPTAAPPVPTGYPLVVNSTGISKGALAGTSSRYRLLLPLCLTLEILSYLHIGAIIGAILGSKILFMLAGYFFYRWWRKQPGHQRGDEDDEKGYARRVLGEPRHHRIPGRNRRGSRGHVDLNEDSTSPRSSRWLAPAYLHPTSFHSQSSRSESSQDRPPPDPQGQPGDVTPFDAHQPPVPESEKSRARRHSASLRVTNNRARSNSGTGNGGGIARPQPAILERARTLSGGTMDSPQMMPMTPMSHSGSLVVQNRSNSDSTGASSGSGVRRYQEDDAGVSLVIEDGTTSSPSSGDGSGNTSAGVRSVPPAYVDYRTGYSRADKTPPPRFDRQTSGNVSVEGTSESATYIGSGSSNPTRAGSVKGDRRKSVEMDGVVEEVRNNGAVVGADDGPVEGEAPAGPPPTTPAANNAGSTSPAATENPPASVRRLPSPPAAAGSPPPATAGSPSPPALGNGNGSAAEPGTSPSTAPGTSPTTGAEDESDVRDRTTSGDSEGTIKPSDATTTELPKPLSRSVTTDLAALTASNTAANRSSGPNTPETITGAGAGAGHPTTTRQISAPAGVTLAAEPAPEPVSSIPAQPAESSWSWSRALGVFGITVPGAPSASPPPPPPPAKD